MSRPHINRELAAALRQHWQRKLEEDAPREAASLAGVQIERRRNARRPIARL